jgi:acetolactate synthase I/II/III large subunit
VYYVWVNMTGADCLLETLAVNRIEVCFMNPGTSEMRFVSSLDRVAAVRGVLCLFEGVCSGAADGYARMTGSPAATLLHLGPGLGNALSNFHNARKARSPIVSIVGEHTRDHRKYDAPLSSDIAQFARAVSSYIRTVESLDCLGPAVSGAIHAAVQPPGCIATLIVPADISWLEAETIGAVVDRPRPSMPSSESITEAARLLRGSGSTGMILGGGSMSRRALEAAGRLAGATGIRVFADRGTPRVASGGGCFPVEKVPYFPEDASAALNGLTHLILVEAQPPVSFFGYPDTPGSPVPETCAVSVLATPEQDGAAALEALVEECGAQKALLPTTDNARPTLPIESPLTVDSMGQTLAALLPESAIVSDEMITASAAVVRYLMRAAAHDQLSITGGAIGQGLPVAVGAAIACPDRKVVALEADGSAMYTLQSLWTMARENLNIVTVIFANRRYRILDVEMRRTGATTIGARANEMLDLGRPDLDFVGLARGMGVPATRATTAQEFAQQFRAAVAEAGPRLIEAVL